MNYINNINILKETYNREVIKIKSLEKKNKINGE